MFNNQNIDPAKISVTLSAYSCYTDGSRTVQGITAAAEQIVVIHGGYNSFFGWGSHCFCDLNGKINISTIYLCN